MVRMFVRHAVEDFGEWKRVYDEFPKKDLGVKDDAVFRSAEDPDDVTVWHDFDDLDSARSFADSDRLRRAMDEAGVTGEPTIWFTERV